MCCQGLHAWRTIAALCLWQWRCSLSQKLRKRRHQRAESCWKFRSVRVQEELMQKGFGEKKGPGRPVAAFKEQRQRHGGFLLASLTPPWGPWNHHRGEECSSEWTWTPQVTLVTQWLSYTDHPSFAELQAAEGALCRTLMEILVQRSFINSKQRYPSVLNNKYVDTLQTLRHLYHLSGTCCWNVNERGK